MVGSSFDGLSRRIDRNASCSTASWPVMKSADIQAERHGIVLIGDQAWRRRGEPHDGVGVQEDPELPIRPAREDQELGVERPASRSVGCRRGPSRELSLLADRVGLGEPVEEGSNAWTPLLAPRPAGKHR